MSKPAVVAAREVMSLYPKIFFACHTRHVRDPQSGRLLSRHQASVLDHLDEVDPITLNGLARHMGVTAGTMSLTIDRALPPPALISCALACTSSSTSTM